MQYLFCVSAEESTRSDLSNDEKRALVRFSLRVNRLGVEALPGYA
jgi:hypothetical protein